MILAGVCWLLAMAGLGCARHPAAPVAAAPQLQTETPAPSPVKAPLATERETAYDRGVRAFDAGEVKKAVAAWRETLAHETDPAVRQRALFALAAVKLSLAASDGELAAAQEMLDIWQKNSPPGGSGEDPRFLVPVARAFKPAFAVKEAKAALEKECARKLADREEQVRRGLQQQVRALESIHREIQEKKKGLTNY